VRRASRRWAVVPAAGRGERYGGRIAKQYQCILGRPVLSWSLGPLLDERSIRAVVVALAAGDRRFHRLAEAADPRVRTCVGGATRDLSVAKALETLADVAHEEDWVLVHDAARPCLAPQDLRKLLRHAGSHAVGGLLASPVADTLKSEGPHGHSERTVSRDGLWRALTPQMFRFGLLRRALALCHERGRPVTDEASAIEALGLRPLLVRGRGDNIKLTRADDHGLAAAILRARTGDENRVRLRRPRV
jgi:2-C-methyl-D-erythritol 4-phosphate cytidylyltransferase